MQSLSTPQAATEQLPEECPLETEHHSRFCPTCSSRLEDSRCSSSAEPAAFFSAARTFTKAYRQIPGSRSWVVLGSGKAPVLLRGMASAVPQVLYMQCGFSR